MKKSSVSLALVAGVAVVASVFSGGSAETVRADDKGSADTELSVPAGVDEDAVARSQKTVRTLDNIFKQTIVLVTDKYVHDEEDFAAGSAAVLLFRNISESGENKVRLIDATGDPYEPENVAKDEFEKEGIRRLKAGAAVHEQVVKKDGKPYLRAVTAVPVVMDRCIMCHAHYADAKKGEPIGAISYTVPVE